MDKKKLTVFICIGILLVVLAGVVVALNLGSGNTENDDKQGQSIEQINEEEQGLQEKDEYEQTEDNSVDFSEILEGNNTEGTASEGSANQVQQEDKTEESIEKKPADAGNGTTEVEEEKYGEIIKP